jgi:hypothetical protein
VAAIEAGANRIDAAAAGLGAGRSKGGITTVYYRIIDKEIVPAEIALFSAPEPGVGFLTLAEAETAGMWTLTNYHCTRLG